MRVHICIYLGVVRQALDAHVHTCIYDILSYSVGRSCITSYSVGRSHVYQQHARLQSRGSIASPCGALGAPCDRS